MLGIVVHDEQTGPRGEGLVCLVTSSLTRAGRLDSRRFGQPEWAKREPVSPPIAPINGAPLRLVIPFRYGARSIKAISEITFGSPGLPMREPPTRG